MLDVCNSEGGSVYYTVALVYDMYLEKTVVILLFDCGEPVMDDEANA